MKTKNENVFLVDINENKELYKIMYEHIVPLLSTRLSQVKSGELAMDEEIMDY